MKLVEKIRRFVKPTRRTGSVGKSEAVIAPKSKKIAKSPKREKQVKEESPGEVTRILRNATNVRQVIAGIVLEPDKSHSFRVIPGGSVQRLIDDGILEDSKRPKPIIIPSPVKNYPPESAEMEIGTPLNLIVSDTPVEDEFSCPHCGGRIMVIASSEHPHS